jgi:D-aminopeptidase
MLKPFLSLVSLLMMTTTAAAEPPRVRARALGVAPGILQPGPLNAITDVAGVAVGQLTRIEGGDVRTGVTAILAHAGNLFQEKVPAGVAVANGFGKLTGTTQIVELGEIETPIILTNTLSVPQAADALIAWTLAQTGNETVASVNPVVGETNDSRLNNIRKRVITRDDVLAAIAAASTGAVTEGAVGAGTGTVAFGWKGGIGTSSRVVPAANASYRVGVLVQTNYGGSLRVLGTEIGNAQRPVGAPPTTRPSSVDGSIMIILATDAPLSDRNLKRLAERSFAGLARTGSAFSNGSGDYALAFSTAASVRRTPQRRAAASATENVPNDSMSALFVAAADATEEAIYNSLFMATPMTGRDSNGDSVVVDAVPIEMIWRLLPQRP